MSGRMSRRSEPAWHLLTAEYPPRIGGVGDYTRQVARALARAGARVHVWCARHDGADAAAVDEEDAAAGVRVHRAFARFTPSELHAAAREARSEAAVRWLVQWVPHQFGWRAMNVALPLWMAQRARAGDEVAVMIHEGGLPFAPGRWRQNVAAMVQRVMLGVAVRAADQLWMSIPGWERVVRSVGGRVLPSRGWLPIPSNIAVVDDGPGVEAWRRRFAPDAAPVVGHFGTFGGPVGERVDRVVPALLARMPSARVALVGAGSDRARDRLAAAHPRHASRIAATGTLEPREVSLAVQACDVMVQPYPDGVSGRRTSTMVSLSHARPVVTNLGELSESVWHDGVVQLAIDDPADMARAAAALLEDAGAQRELAAAGRGLYDALFSIERIVAVLRGERPPAAPGLVSVLAGAAE